MITCATYSFGESSRAFVIDSLASAFSFRAPCAPARASQARGLWGYFATSCWPRASWPARSLSKPFRVIWIWSRSASDAPAEIELPQAFEKVCPRLRRGGRDGMVDHRARDGIERGPRALRRGAGRPADGREHERQGRTRGRVAD